MEIQTGKELLIVIDDTDKLPAEKGRSVFFENGHHLASVQANVIFVVDLSVSTYSEFPQIRSKFSGDEFFPAIKVRERDRSQSEDTKRYVAILAALAGRRVPAEFIDEEALARAIELTGGVVRELIRILNYAIFAAEGKIQLDHVEGAANKIANEFNLYGEHTLIMHKVLDDPDWLAREEAGDKEKVILSLLHMPALFQYRNGEIKWYRPYPVFDGWLKRLYPGPQLLT